MTTNTLRVCPACASEASNPTAFSKQQWKVVACKACEFVFLQNPPKYEALEEDYAFEKTFEVEAKRRVDDEPLFSSLSRFMIFLKNSLLNRDKPYWLLAKYVKDGDVVVDVGSGNGKKFAKAAAQLQRENGVSITPIGLEISIASAELASANLEPFGGQCVQNNAIDGLKALPDAYANCVQMRAFLEHEMNPLTLLQEAHRVLEKGGVTIIKVPNFACFNRTVRKGRWCGFRYPDHVNYFVPTNLQQMLRDAGFSVERMSFLDRFPLNDNMYIVGRK